MRNWIFGLTLLLLAASPAHADEASVMVLKGDASVVYDNGIFTVFDPALIGSREEKKVAPGSPTPGEEPPSGALPPGAIAQAPIGPDGHFRLEMAVEQPQTVYFAVLEAVSRDGTPIEPINKGTNFILEQGELNLRMKRNNYAVITGGYYNDAVYNTWRLTDEYREAQEDYGRLLTYEVHESEEDRQLHSKRLMEAGNGLAMLEREGMHMVTSTQTDPLILRLASESFMAYEPEHTRMILDHFRQTQEGQDSDAGIFFGGHAREVWLIKDGQKDLATKEETLDGESTRANDARTKSR